jgi:molybdenum cofactor guanylyltransferase
MAVRKMAAAILAGGMSSRMGKNKAFLPLKGKPLVFWVHQALQEVFEPVIVVGSREVGELLQVNSYPDAGGGERPSSIRGIYTGLIASPTLHTFFAPCDMPFLSTAALRDMRQGLPPGCDAYVPRHGEYWQPLHAIYSKNCLPVIEAQLRKKNHKIMDFYDKVKTCTLDMLALDSLDPEVPLFFNINTAADLEEARKLVSRVRAGGGNPWSTTRTTT